jgi:hypothetical protein
VRSNAPVRSTSSNHRNRREEGIPISNPNRPSVKTRFNDVVAGIKKNITGNVTIGGVAYTPVTLSAVFTDAITAMDTADAAHKQWLDEVAAMQASVATARGVYGLLRNFLIGQHGTNDKSVLGDFGMATPKTQKKTVATKAAAVVKAKATRDMRHTMGPKQKKLVKSNVEVQIAAVPANGSSAPDTGGAQTAATTPAPNGAAPAATAKSGS